MNENDPFQKRLLMPEMEFLKMEYKYLYWSYRAALLSEDEMA